MQTALEYLKAFALGVSRKLKTTYRKHIYLSNTVGKTTFVIIGISFHWSSGFGCNWDSDMNNLMFHEMVILDKATYKWPCEKGLKLLLSIGSN